MIKDSCKSSELVTLIHQCNLRIIFIGDGAL